MRGALATAIMNLAVMTVAVLSASSPDAHRIAGPLGQGGHAWHCTQGSHLPSGRIKRRLWQLPLRLPCSLLHIGALVTLAYTAAVQLHANVVVLPVAMVGLTTVLPSPVAVVGTKKNLNFARDHTVEHSHVLASEPA